MSTAVLILVAALIFMAIAVLLKKRIEEGVGGVMPAFKRKKPLTQPEEVLYHRLVEALPEYVVLAQVQLTALMSVRGRGQQTWFNKISRKSVDYVICLKDFTVVAALELDDKSHEKEARMAADADKDRAFEAAGIKLLRLKGMELPNVEVLRMMIQRLTPIDGAQR